MVYIVAIAFTGLVALGVVAHGARISRIPARKHLARRYFLLGAVLMIFTCTLLLLQQAAI